MGCLEDKLLHPHRLQRGVYPAADLLCGDTQVLRAESHILLHHIGHDLVIRVLEHHAYPSPDLQQVLLIAGVHSIHPYRAARRQQHRVHVFGQSGFPGAIVAKHCHKAAPFNFQ